MFRTIRQWAAMAIPALFLGAGAIQAAPPQSSGEKPAQSRFVLNEVIVVQEKGKPDRKCLVLAAVKQADGSIAYKLKALDNGDTITIYDRTAPMTSSGVAEKPMIPEKTVAEKPKQEKPMASDIRPITPPRVGLLDRIAQPNPARTQVTEACKPCETIIPKQKPPREVRTTIEPAKVAEMTKPTPPTITPFQAVEATKPTHPVDTGLILPAMEPTKPTVSAPIAQPVEKPITPSAPAVILPAANTTPLADIKVPVVPAFEPIGPLPKYHPPAEVNTEEQRIATLKATIKDALRPSEREDAIEKLAESARGRDADIRAFLLMTAKEDPAATVRLTAIRSLAKQGVKDQALMTVLVAAQEDGDSRVREEAEFALQRLSRMK